MLLGQIQLNGSHAEGFFPPTQASEIAGNRKAIFREEASVRGENSPGRWREVRPQQEMDRSDAA